MEWPKQNTGVFAVPICVFCTLPGLQWRSIGGELYVQGIHSMNWDGQTPYNVYRGYTISGEITQKIYEPSEEVQCANLLFTNVNGCSGAYSVTPSASDPTGYSVDIQDTVACYGPGGYPCILEEYAETVHTQTGCGGCLDRRDGTYEHTTGTITKTAIDLVEDADAISHLKTYGLFTDWDSAPTHANHSGRTYEFYTAQFRFTYHDVEWRLVRPGLTPGVEYKCTVPVYRKDLSGWEDFAWYADQTVTAVADSAGIATFSATVPNDQGYETYVDGEPLVEPVET